MADDKGKKVFTFRLSDESINCYGFRVLTDGIDLTDFLKNPVMLWNHIQSNKSDQNQVLPIGRWENVRKENGQLLADAVFDLQDEFAAKIAGKVERGFIKTASIGLQNRELEFSDDAALMLEGQTGPTITRCRMREASVTDISSNKNSVVLYDDSGQEINLSDSASSPILNRKTQSDTMSELKVIAIRLGLSESSDGNTVQAKIIELQEKASKADVLQAKIDGLEAAQKAARKTEAETLLNDATAAGKITADQRAAYAKLFDADHESAKTVLAGLPAPTKLSDVGKPGGSPGAPGATYNGKTFAQLSKDEPQVLADLKDSDPATFKALFKAQYGKDYKG